MKRLLVMITFLTRIPIPIRFDVAYEDYVKGVKWTPLIALIIGLPLYFAGMLSAYVDRLIIAVFVLALYVMISGGLHVDGLADTMDAFGSNRSRTRMLEILSDTKMGTFGVLGIVMWCVSMVVLISKTPLFALLLFPIVGRMCALLCARTNVYAREGGLGKSFVEGASAWHMAIALLMYTGCVYLAVRPGSIMCWAAALIPALAAVIGVWVLVRSMCRKIGGITGDLIGFSVEISQVIYLLLIYIAAIIL